MRREDGRGRLSRYLLCVCANKIYLVLRAADRYAYTGCGSTAYSVGTVYGGKGELYTPDARPALLATPRRLTGDALPRLTGDALACLTGDALSLH
jgi:hypothetical protein